MSFRTEEKFYTDSDKYIDLKRYLILKNNTMRSYFPAQENSQYYRSASFKSILNFIQHNMERCIMKEEKGKLSLKIKDILNIEDAITICNMLQKKAV